LTAVASFKDCLADL